MSLSFTQTGVVRIAAATVVTLSFFTAAVRADLVHQWSLDGNLLDSSGNGNTGTLNTGSASYVTGRFGKAINLASGQSVNNLAASAIPTATTDSWSINLWANYASSPPAGAYLGGIGTRADDGTSNKRALIQFNNHQYFWGGGDDFDTGAGYPAVNAWHMFTVTYDQPTATLSWYADGALVNSTTKTFTANAAAQVGVGGAPEFFGSSYAGKIDEFSIHNSVLTSTQMAQLQAYNRLAALGITRTFENADHSMTAGQAGVSWIKGNGDIATWNGADTAVTTSVTGAAATEIIAAHISSSTDDQIAYVKGGALYTYNFATNTSTNQGGSGIADITAADFDSTGEAIINVVNTAGNMYFWTLAGGYGSIVNDGASLAQRVNFGELDSAHTGPEFVGVYQPGTTAANNMRIISRDNTNTLTFTGIGGSGINEVAAANVYNNGGNNEVVLTNNVGDIFLWEGSFTQVHNNAAGFAMQLAAADLNGNGVDEVYYINASDNKIYGYSQGLLGDTAGDNLLSVLNNSDWAKLLSADLNGDGLDELYGLKLNDDMTLYRYTDGSTGFAAVAFIPAPSAAPAGLGLLALSVLSRRRR